MTLTGLAGGVGGGQRPPTMLTGSKAPAWWGFPVEVVVDGRPGYVDADLLGVSATLRQDLRSSGLVAATRRGDNEGTDASEEPDWARWREQGNQPVQRLQAERREDDYVTWN